MNSVFVGLLSSVQQSSVCVTVYVCDRESECVSVCVCVCVKQIIYTTPIGQEISVPKVNFNIPAC